MNLGTILVLAALTLVTGGVIRSLIIRKKTGKSSCGCKGCSGDCGACGSK